MSIRSEDSFKRAQETAAQLCLPPNYTSEDGPFCSVGLPSTADVHVLPTTILLLAGSKRLVKSLKAFPLINSVNHGIRPQKHLNFRSISVPILSQDDLQLYTSPCNVREHKKKQQIDCSFELAKTNTSSPKQQ